ncbi:RHS repeat protein [Pseudomonas sp. CDFA 602]|nr:RHS repeat-associated core domain-containing protein [Pseudomonas californiensis]MCD5993404.1 RHS repeat protein [Pseudomonas californiensis]MCD5998805.1 RHS repeat protein [Pseudomonas californiensis]
MVRCVVYCRRSTDVAAQRQLTRFTCNAAGQQTDTYDTRLMTPNSTTVRSLSGMPLLTESVDAGWRVMLSGIAGQTLDTWDSRDSHRRVEYDTLLRPVSITDEGFVTERFMYGGPGTCEHNQCNRLIRHDDTAGTLRFSDYSVPGSSISESRQFLKDVSTPDWPLEEAEREALLESARLETLGDFNASGEQIRHVDAQGNSQHFSQTVAGQLQSVSLSLAGVVGLSVLVDNIIHNAFGQVEQETAGNWVVSQYTYDAQDGRLIEQCTSSPDSSRLQHFKYRYDPVGNILELEDAAQSVRFFANQRIEPINRYRYDTLYQLIEATGFEVITGASHGPDLPDLQTPPDANQLANYTQRYDYDPAGNLLEMRHIGTQCFTRKMRVAPDSNRSLIDDGDADFASGFDANGNLLQLVRGQSMSWDARNQLQRITSVQRTDGPNDEECYVYDGDGQRCRKISSAQASGRTLINEVRYLPALEIRTNAVGETLHVITAQAGRNSVRVLHWVSDSPVANNQLRYSLTDHLGSCTLELDQSGGLISQERYYPFGGTACWAARSEVEANYKTVRYSGKERDASGLYYYGFRYYAPWLQRWISCDPAVDFTEHNLYRFVENNPLGWVDAEGLVGTDPNRPKHISYEDSGLEAKIEAVKNRRSVVFNFMDTHYKHFQEQRYTMYSEYTLEGTRQENTFENKFKPYKWTFISNFRNVSTDLAHANDVALKQYELISQKEGFMGHLPSVIKRDTVVNVGVLKVAHDYESESEALKTAFFEDTQNGKSTQRILDDFGLVADKITTRFLNDAKDQVDVYIHVSPKNPVAPKPAAPLSVAPATASRFSVTPVSPVIPQPATSTAVVATAQQRASRFSVVPVAQGSPTRRRSSTASLNP